MHTFPSRLKFHHSSGPCIADFRTKISQILFIKHAHRNFWPNNPHIDEKRRGFWPFHGSKSFDTEFLHPEEASWISDKLVPGLSRTNCIAAVFICLYLVSPNNHHSTIPAHWVSQLNNSRSQNIITFSLVRRGPHIHFSDTAFFSGYKKWKLHLSSTLFKFLNNPLKKALIVL